MIPLFAIANLEGLIVKQYIVEENKPKLDLRQQENPKSLHPKTIIIKIMEEITDTVHLMAVEVSLIQELFFLTLITLLDLFNAHMEDLSANNVMESLSIMRFVTAETKIIKTIGLYF